MAHRFFVSPDSIQNRVVHLTETQAHQIRDVLRMTRGTEIVVLDNTGNEYRVILNHLTREGAQGEVVEKRAAMGEPRTQIFLYQALLKADKMEWVLQKGTELGIAGFVPIASERSVREVGKNKFARWAHIITEAAEQAGRGKIPTLSAHVPMTRALKAARELGGLMLVPWELEQAISLNTALGRRKAGAVHLFVGPEGGFSDKEIEKAREVDAETITLGPRILRAETAGLVAASAILFACGDLSHA